MSACRHCGRVDSLVAVVSRTGERFMLCKDSIRCSRRRMAADGIRLLPHPKNPEPLAEAEAEPPGWGADRKCPETCG